jgi:hypothetical protein
LEQKLQDATRALAAAASTAEAEAAGAQLAWLVGLKERAAAPIPAKVAAFKNASVATRLAVLETKARSLAPLVQDPAACSKAILKEFRSLARSIKNLQAKAAGGKAPEAAITAVPAAAVATATLAATTATKAARAKAARAQAANRQKKAAAKRLAAAVGAGAEPGIGVVVVASADAWELVAMPTAKPTQLLPVGTASAAASEAAAAMGPLAAHKRAPSAGSNFRAKPQASRAR